MEPQNNKTPSGAVSKSFSIAYVQLTFRRTAITAQMHGGKLAEQTLLARWWPIPPWPDLMETKRERERETAIKGNFMRDIKDIGHGRQGIRFDQSRVQAVLPFCSVCLSLSLYRPILLEN